MLLKESTIRLRNITARLKSSISASCRLPVFPTIARVPLFELNSLESRSRGHRIRRRFLDKTLVVALLTTVTLCGSPGVWAKSRWYQIEVIVFRHADADAAGGEQWLDLESLPDFRDAIELLVDLPEFSDEPPVDGAELLLSGPIAFQSLSSDALLLSDVFRRLENLSAYEPVLHVGWRQPGFGGSRARSVYISDKPSMVLDAAIDDTAVVPNPSPSEIRVEGTIRVRTGRLLHVDTDFVSYGADSPVRITEQRKVKLKELHYFDHPLFGVIVQVVPYRVPDPHEQPSEVVGSGSVEDR